MNPATLHLTDPDPLHRNLEFWETRYYPTADDRCPHCGAYCPYDADCYCQSDWEGDDDAKND